MAELGISAGNNVYAKKQESKASILKTGLIGAGAGAAYTYGMGKYALKSGKAADLFEKARNGAKYIPKENKFSRNAAASALKEFKTLIKTGNYPLKTYIRSAGIWGGVAAAGALIYNAFTNKSEEK